MKLIINMARIIMKPTGRPISGSCAKIAGLSFAPPSSIARVVIIEIKETAVTPIAPYAKKFSNREVLKEAILKGYFLKSTPSAG